MILLELRVYQMFHYSLAPLNNRSRMLIAAFLAVALHIGLMNFKFDLKPVRMPSVVLPRSVSVFLGQRSMVETPVVQTEKAQTADHLLEEQPAAETEPEKPVLQNVSMIKEKTDNTLKQPALPAEFVKQPVVEKTKSALHKSEDVAEDIPKAGKSAKSKERATRAGLHAKQEEQGIPLPGALHMAYPRYHLNDPPLYPGLARKRGQEGTVILQVLVNKEGRVDTLEIENSSGFGLLDRAAVASVRKWSFEPGKRGEERMPMWVRVPVTFKLKK